jgi:hypothetical protein
MIEPEKKPIEVNLPLDFINKSSQGNRVLGGRGMKGNCKAELELLSKMEKASVGSRERCELVCRILTGDSIEAIDETLKQKKEAP